ncbi:hypothetical protein MTR67_050724 [Solanum verrucosum]|uniref:Uncharacterized protein n=1 Tax=Solanum verrucosum TaxID=315347 RepID=A0AAF0V4Y5_SOLVR|nr:hypothetical protein MTR67_050724 [Solanum verrucosum]
MKVPKQFWTDAISIACFLINRMPSSVVVGNVLFPNTLLFPYEPKSLLRLKEPSVLLRCRKDDVNLVEDVLDAVKEEYAEKAMVHTPEIIIDHIHLPPAPSHHNAHGPSCSGGVVLASRDGKIVCENTLDARLEVVFRKKLPEVLTFVLTSILLTICVLVLPNFLFSLYQC